MQCQLRLAAPLPCMSALSTGINHPCIFRMCCVGLVPIHVLLQPVRFGSGFAVRFVADGACSQGTTAASLPFLRRATSELEVLLAVAYSEFEVSASPHPRCQSCPAAISPSLNTKSQGSAPLPERSHALPCPPVKKAQNTVAAGRWPKSTRAGSRSRRPRRRPSTRCRCTPPSTRVLHIISSTHTFIESLL